MDNDTVCFKPTVAIYSHVYNNMFQFEMPIFSSLPFIYEVRFEHWWHYTDGIICRKYNMKHALCGLLIVFKILNHSKTML